MLEYKGYIGEVTELDEDSEVISGRVAGLGDVVTFEGRTAKELAQAFRDSVDDYLAFCAELGRAPENPSIPAGVNGA